MILTAYRVQMCSQPAGADAELGRFWVKRLPAHRMGTRRDRIPARLLAGRLLLAFVGQAASQSKRNRSPVCLQVPRQVRLLRTCPAWGRTRELAWRAIARAGQGREQQC